jgi:CheY-like chemotaxis protein
LSVVVGQATLLMEGTHEPKVASRAEKIFKAADRCSRIVKSFLALARRKPPERKPVDLNQIARGSLELLGYQLRTGDVTIETNLDAALPQVTGDGDQLTQVITNLVLNSAQAMEGWKGPHRIMVSSEHDAFNNVTLTIADTGPGIPNDIRVRVFEPFFTTKGGKGGTGVGLALCLNIVASHGGELLLTDTPGGGATFSVKLPAAEQTQVDDIAAAGHEPLSFGKIKLLLVDDEIEIAQTLADLMEPDGHDIDIAINGQVALDKLRKHTYDAIISDLRMPVMDGPALYEALQRELPSYLNRIIYVTGDTLSSHVQDFLRSHPVPVVEKPYRLKDIRHALSDLLNHASHKTG